MSRRKFLVVGATGHVGSKVTVLLAERGSRGSIATQQIKIQVTI